MLSRISSRSNRLFSSISSVSHSKDRSDCLSINLRNGSAVTNVKVPLVWLRDHCRSTTAYNHTTNQRKSKMLNLLDEARISDRDAVKYDENKLTIKWRDGHESMFDSDLLIQMIVKTEKKRAQDLYHLWNGSSIEALPTVKKSAFSFPEFSRKFVQFGFVSVEGIEQTPEATEK
ncbi:hypothetical protein PMAYCL1PPCAC_07600 [Pristionchus mayeri]|uniref:Gamma-butyrobetaine hydroxylase-like N-terminal domain-containing protein n=1 Tax=Pristionchus mayeri TaxID=1317129 RepID=A0AAN4ZGT1_9BILA|nr:hypothetical protein PMAYCL1PPCAC_07600 [Pristionchus mayeri]